MKRRALILTGGLLIGIVGGLSAALLQVAALLAGDFVDVPIVRPADLQEYPFSLLLFHESFWKKMTFGLLLAFPAGPILYAIILKYYVEKFRDPKLGRLIVSGVIAGWGSIFLGLYWPPTF